MAGQGGCALRVGMAVPGQALGRPRNRHRRTVIMLLLLLLHVCHIVGHLLHVLKVLLHSTNRLTSL